MSDKVQVVPVTIHVYLTEDGRVQVQTSDTNNPDLCIQILQDGIEALEGMKPVTVN